MKRNHLLMLGAMGLLMASCSDEEDRVSMPVNEGSISFRPALSRASETTNANLSVMYVTALEQGSEADYFADLEYKKGNDGFFTSTPAYFWPGDDSPLTFYAYSPSMDELGADITINADKKVMENFSVAENIADQVDFITATATGKKSVNEDAGVELNFAHQLSQIEVQAKSSNQAYNMKVAGARVGRAEFMAQFDFTTSTWTLDDWHDDTVYETQCDTATLTETPVSLMGDAGNIMLLPQKQNAWDYKGDPDNVAHGTYISVLINITTKDGAQVYPFASDTKLDDSGKKRTFAWASIPVTVSWEAGKKYIYTLDFTNGAGYVDPDDPTPGKPVLGEPIKFTVNVEPWVNTPSDEEMITK